MRVHEERDLAAAFEGAMLGLAVGDALAYPCEFRTRAAILASFGPAGVTDLVGIHDERWPEKPWILGKSHPPGTYSDDTQMSVAVARALLDTPDGDLDGIMTAMAARFVEWSRGEDNDRAPGQTCMTGCRRLGRGVPWREAGVPDSKGAGAPMRAVPIGLRFHRDLPRLLAVARASSLPTHGHPAAVESSAAVAHAVALALDRRSPDELLAALVETHAGRAPELDASLAALSRLRSAPPERALVDGALGEAWIAEEAVACALYCFLRTPDDYRATVVTAANTDGDSDTIACIAGGISGAYNGPLAIPREWREGVENAALLAELGRRLHAVAAADAPCG